jgi:hypothetical protein
MLTLPDGASSEVHAIGLLTNGGQIIGNKLRHERVIAYRWASHKTCHENRNVRVVRCKGVMKIVGRAQGQLILSDTERYATQLGTWHVQFVSPPAFEIERPNRPI